MNDTRRNDTWRNDFGKPAVLSTRVLLLVAGVTLGAAVGAAGPLRAEDTTIRVTTAKPAPPIPRRLFGKFTEHLGRNIYHGMWAQVLRNPGFEEWKFFSAREHGEKQAASMGLSAYWLPLSGESAQYALGADCALPGQTSQDIEVTKVEDGHEVGLKQEGVYLPLHRESDYLVSFRSEGEGLSSGFAMSIREGSRALARVVFPPPAKEWEARSAELTIPRGSVPAGAALTFAVEVLSAGKLSLDLLEIFPRDAIDGFDRDVVRLCREARLPLLRYPGGNFVSGYHWRDGVGPRETRPMQHNPAWDVPEYNHVGTGEFLAFCRAAGCEPMICVNAGNGTAEEAAAWVEYANGPVTTPMGQLRARNGHPEPYGIKVWEVGNELYGDWQIGHTTAADYAERYLRFARAMSAADPSIELIANGHDRSWNRTVLERCAGAARSLSVHPLIGGGTPPSADPEKTFRALMAYPTAFENDVRAQLAWAAERQLSPRFAVTELQIFTNREELPSNSTLSEALFLGRFVHAAIRLGGAIEMITHSALVNHGGGLSKRGEVVWAQPVQHAHALYGTMSGVRPVPVEVICRKYSAAEPRIPRAENAPELDAVALLDGTGEELTIIAINTNPTEDVTAAVQIDDPGARPVRARRVDGASYMTRNSASSPDAAALRRIEPPAAGQGRFRFPPHSITEVVFGLK